MRAYEFDSAIATFGNALNVELEEIEGSSAREVKGKRERVLRRWLETPEQRAKGSGFADPAKIMSGR